jgi:opacity protein-like surface antigen
MMRRIANVIAMSACMLMIEAPSAIADVVSDELAEMRALVEQLKGQVDAQSEQIEHQGEVIREARLEQVQRGDSRFGASGLAGFLQRLEIEGWVAGSYFWNFNDPGSSLIVGGNSGVSGNVYPFHSNYNSFQVDQVWFGLEHPVDEENRAGFRFDLVYATACTLGASPGERCKLSDDDFFEDVGDNTSQYYVNQAYVQYLAPITSNGIHIKAGKFGTLIGAEVAQTTANFNITRGNVYNLLQPIDHIGVLASTKIGESGFSAAFGVLNDIGTGDPDFNDAKSITAQVAWAGETVSVANTLVWGPPHVGMNDNSTGIYDVLVNWDPMESLSTWLNFDYAWGRTTAGQKQHAWGLATAARYAISERMGIAGRFEYVADDDFALGWVDDPMDPGAGVSRDASIFSLTGTVDYALTSNLMVRAEVRYDDISKDNSSDDEFFDSVDDWKPEQVTAGVEIVYEF